MPSLTTKRTCPYCGSRIELGRCPIVATNVETATLGEFDRSLVEIPSGAKPVGWAGRWPVLAEPPSPKRSERPSRFKEMLSSPASLPRVTQLARAEDLPARVCPDCDTPLPVDLDEREAFIIAVVGINRAGKTHFIASTLREAARRDALVSLGCEEFVPDEETGNRYQRDYFTPLFRRRELLEATDIEEDVMHRPLSYRVTFENQEPSVLLLHDVAGEALADRRLRARVAPFLRRADGVIFLIDPTEIDLVRELLPGEFLEDYADYDQAHLLSACVAEMRQLRGSADVPFAVTLSKSDLLVRAMGRDFRFAKNRPGNDLPIADVIKDLADVSAEVEDLLEELEASDLLAAARQLDNNTFCAISALGHAPEVGQLTEPVSPVRCIDPLLAVIAGMLSNSGRR